MRVRSGQDLINDAYKKVDLEAFTNRYPRPDVLRWINQGGAELWDILLAALGKTYARSSSPWEITTAEDTIEYSADYPEDFLELLSVRLTCPYNEMLTRLATPEEAFLRSSESATTPMHYDLIPGGIQLFPKHQAGCCVVVEYAKTFTDLTDSPSSSFDGINGWEEYLVCHAAREMMLKEGEPEMARLLENDKLALAERIKKRAPNRDGFRQRRVKDVRGERMAAWRWWGR